MISSLPIFASFISKNYPRMLDFCSYLQIFFTRQQKSIDIDIELEWDFKRAILMFNKLLYLIIYFMINFYLKN